LDYAGRDSGVIPTQRDELVKAVEDAIRTRRVPPPKQVSGLPSLLAADGSEAGRSAMRIVGLWKVDEHRRGVLEVQAATTADAVQRAAALEGLALFGDDRAKAFIKALCADPKPEVRRAAIMSFASLDVPAAASTAAEFLAEAKPSEDLLDLYSAFVTRKGGAAALAKALAGKKLNSDVAKLGLRAVRAAIVKNDGGLSDALTKSGGLAMKKEATPEDVKARVAHVLANSDPVRGEAVLRRKELQCLACHGIGGAGGQVGPDLTSIGASAPVDYLVESLLLPNKAVKDGFPATRVVTADDKVLVVGKVREAVGQLVLRTPEDKEVVIPTNDIFERGEAKSLMPEALTDPLTRQEFADLVRFLSELGKVGAYAPSTARVVRRWQIIEPTPENMNLARRTRLAAAAEPGTPFTWSPVYSHVSGKLPLAELPKLVVWSGNDPLAVVRFHLDVTTAGKVKLKFNSIEGLTLFVAGKPVEPKPETEIDLATGMQPITLVIDRSKRTEDVRVELADVAGSPARAAIVGGK
jgi:putative heme-binding domain-containing protein